MAKTECGLDDDAPISQAPAHAIPSVPLSALIYIETTFPSFYHETRPKPELVAMRNWTRDWWQQAAATNQFVTSDAVLAELDLTPEPKRTECHALTGTLPILEDLLEIDETGEFYIRHKLMPATSPSPRGIRATSSSLGIAATLRTRTNWSTFITSMTCSGCTPRSSPHRFNSWKPKNELTDHTARRHRRSHRRNPRDSPPHSRRACQ